MAHVLRVQRRARNQRGGALGRGLAFPGRDGEFAKKPRPAARLAKRQSFGSAAGIAAQAWPEYQYNRKTGKITPASTHFQPDAIERLRDCFLFIHEPHSHTRDSL